MTSPAPDLAEAAASAAASATVRRAAVFTSIAIGAVALYAGWELRPLGTDGANYLHNILRHEEYDLAAPARRVVEWVRQTPVILAMRLGLTDLAALTAIFSFSIALAPLGITTFCWFLLPADKKWFFIFPLFHFCAGSLASMATPFQEGPTGAAIFWCLFYFILFRVRNARTVDIAFLLALPTFVLYEAMLFLGPVLTVAAWLRARDLVSRADRIVLRAAAAWFLVAAAIQIDFIAYPRYPGHGAGFVQGLLSGGWIVDDNGSFNLSAALGAAALALAGAVASLASRRHEPGWRATRIAVVAFALVAAAALAYLWTTDRMLDVNQQVRARNNALLFSFPLAIAALIALKWPAKVSVRVVRGSAALCMVLAAVGLLWQFNSVLQWSRALNSFRATLAEERGFVEWDDALQRMSPDRRRLASRLLYGWTASPMSLVLAPGGQVRTIVGTTRPVGYRPFDPLDLDKLPRSRFWYLEPYLGAVREKRR